MEFPSGGLRPCSNRAAPRKRHAIAGASEEDNGGDRTTVPESNSAEGPDQAAVVPRTTGKRGTSWNSKKTTRRDALSSSSSSFSSSSSSSASLPPPSWQQRGGGVHVGSRRRVPLLSRSGGRGGDDLRDLALPLGMSFAAVIAQVLDRKDVGGGSIPADRLSMICYSAMKEAVANVYGKRFDCFMRNFEKSFGSTLKTLRVINEVCLNEQGNSLCTSHSSNCFEAASIQGTPPESLNAIEDIQENCPLNSVDNQLVLHAEINQQLAHVSQNRASSGFSRSVVSTLEKSVMEQARSNDLKAVEIGLTIKRLQLKQSQLDLNSYSNFLERMKISMGISKASFKEEKLKNQMQDLRHAELLKRCIDLLVTGLIIMSGFLVYGASIYSYKRIMEATASCTSTPKESKSWWVPKPVASFSSGWLMLRCHAVVLTRMSFGVLMILAVAYSVFQRSASSGSTMPVTFILLLLGVACGVAGKLCVDTLGGNGCCWLFYWEVLCLLHFFANAFPSALYYILHGPVSLSREAKQVLVPYWVRRYAFYTVLILILPILTGLTPFASIHDWKEHFSSMIVALSFGREMGD